MEKTIRQLSVVLTIVVMLAWTHIGVYMYNNPEYGANDMKWLVLATTAATMWVSYLWFGIENDGDAEFIRDYLGVSKSSLHDIMNEYGFELSDMIIGNSPIHGCSVYKTNYSDVYITDYDLFNKEKNTDRCAFIVNYHKGKVVKVTFEFMESAKNYFMMDLENIADAN